MRAVAAGIDGRLEVRSQIGRIAAALKGEGGLGFERYVLIAQFWGHYLGDYVLDIVMSNVLQMVTIIGDFFENI